MTFLHNINQISKSSSHIQKPQQWSLSYLQVRDRMIARVVILVMTNKVVIPVMIPRAVIPVMIPKVVILVMTNRVVTRLQFMIARTHTQPLLCLLASREMFLRTHD